MLIVLVSFLYVTENLASAAAASSIAPAAASAQQGALAQTDEQYLQQALEQLEQMPVEKTGRSEPMPMGSVLQNVKKCGDRFVKAHLNAAKGIKEDKDSDDENPRLQCVRNG